RNRPFRAGPRRLRERDPPRRALGALSLLRPCRAGLVRVRLGDPAPRDRLSRDLPRPAPRPTPVSPPPSPDRGPVALSLARLPHHGRRGAHQVARGPVLAGPHVPLLALRDAAHPEYAQLAASLHAALVPSRGRAVQSLR